MDSLEYNAVRLITKKEFDQERRIKRLQFQISHIARYIRFDDIPIIFDDLRHLR